MLCKNCGAEVVETAKFCPACGTAMQAEPEQPIVIAEEVAEAPVQEPVAPAEEPAAPAQASEEPVKEKKTCPIKPLLEKAKPLAEKVKPLVQKYKLPLIGAACVLLLVLAIGIIASVCGSGNGYIATENTIIATVDDDYVVILWNNKMIKTKIEADYVADQVNNLTSTIAAFRTSEDELYVVKNKKVTKVAEDVAYFQLSTDGNGIGYVVYDEDDECTLKLYSVSKKKSVTVMKDCDLYSLNYYGFELAPDGKSMAYYQFDSEEYEATLMFFNGSKSIKITSSEVELLGLSNNGKYIYAIADHEGEDVLYTYNKKGDRDKIGVCTSSGIYFNEDHTQVLYLNDGKTYLSINGKSGTKFSSSQAKLVLSNDSNSVTCNNAVTYPVKDLYGYVYAVYSDGQYNLWTLEKNNDKSEKLVSGVKNWTMDAKCDYIYYTRGSTLFVLKISHGERASDRSVYLADDVSKFVVTSDRKKVYFISDGGLYSCNGTNGNAKRTISSDDVESYYLYINAKDVVYYIKDEDCYACSNGRKGTKILTNVEGLMGYNNTIVYAATEDTLYVTVGSKRMAKLYDNN